jgi:hypothetical protein
MLRSARASPNPLDELAVAARLFSNVPSFLRRRLDPHEARASLRRRLENREADFLSLVQRAIFHQERSPYRQLLGVAGCEFGDLHKLVRQDGIEGALQVLHGQGVYLSVDEFKGRRAAVRGSATVEVGPARLRNPLSGFHMSARSSGSRGPATPALIDLAFVRDCAVDTLLAFEAWGGLGWVKATWQSPGGMATFRLLKHSSFGSPVARWFSLVDPKTPGLHPRYRWSARALHWESLLVGVPLPMPQHVSFEDPLPIASWMTGVIDAGRTPHLFALVSPAVHLCQIAFERGLDLQGARFMLAGEPVTEARVAVIRRVGAQAMPRYGSVECGPIGYACLAPQEVDDVHLLHDLHAMIQPERPATAALPRPRHRVSRAVPPNALFITSLRESSPFVLLNVSMGDEATLIRRACGCPMERLGWAMHLHGIRSYEKLTGLGTTFLASDLIRVLEEVLPPRFGGTPTDYQLLEEEGSDGAPCVRLLVEPGLGPLDEREVAEAFLAEVAGGSGGERMMGLLWRDAGLLSVERRPPVMTASGKIHHLVLGSGATPAAE